MRAPGSSVVFHANLQGGDPPSVMSSSNQSETSTAVLPLFQISMYWSEFEPMSPSLFQSVPL